MNTLLRLWSALTALLLVSVVVLAQGNFSTLSDGNWNNPAVWTLLSGTDADGIPDADDNVTIKANHDVTVDADAACNDLSLNDGSVDWVGSSIMFNAGKTLTVNGTFTWGFDATHPGQVNMSEGGTLVLKGAIYSPSPQLIAGSGTVNLNGTSTQTVGGTLTFNNLTVDNAAGTTLLSNCTVNGTLYFANGKLSLVSDRLTIGSSGSISNANASRYVVTNGKLFRNGVGTTAMEFPVGTSSSYNPVTIATGSGTDNFGVRVIGSVSPTSANDAAAVQRTWDIVEGTPGGNGTMTVTVQWNGSEEGGSFSPRAAGVSWRHNGTVWVEEGSVTSIAGTDPYTATITGLTSFSRYTIGLPGALPIQLASLSAHVVRENDVEVVWKTISEVNNYGFEIYRRRGEAGDPANGGAGWQKIGFVEGHGTTLAPQSYYYVDRSVRFGKYYYRIKQVDLDGTSETFSEIEVAVGTGPDKFVLTQNYPNPFNPSTLIEFVVPKSGVATVKVYNVLGQEVASLFEGNAEEGKIYAVRFDASKLPSGLYFYTLRSAGKVETKKMLLMK